MVKLTAEQQESFVQSEPAVFTPFNGAWGTRRSYGGTSSGSEEDYHARGACLAWSNRAPKRLAQEFDVE